MIATRRLAAILAADVAGYSRLIGCGSGSQPETPNTAFTCQGKRVDTKQIGRELVVQTSFATAWPRRLSPL
jgi:hypothetical protein